MVPERREYVAQHVTVDPETVQFGSSGAPSGVSPRLLNVDQAEEQLSGRRLLSRAQILVDRLGSAAQGPEHSSRLTV